MQIEKEEKERIRKTKILIHRHLFLNRGGHLGTTDDFTTKFEVIKNSKNTNNYHKRMKTGQQIRCIFWAALRTAMLCEDYMNNYT